MAKRKNSPSTSFANERSHFVQNKQQSSILQKSPPGVDKKTLVSTLSQAIHLNDISMLEMVFSEGLNDPSLIEITVRRLPQTLVIPFLKRLEVCVVDAPNRLEVYLPWISSLMSAHCSLVLSTPSLSEQLKNLLEIFEARLSSRLELERLLGKLNFLVDRIEMRLEGGTISQEDQFVPAQSFSEKIEEKTMEPMHSSTDDTDGIVGEEDSDQNASNTQSDEDAITTTSGDDSKEDSSDDLGEDDSNEELDHESENEFEEESENISASDISEDGDFTVTK